MTITRTFYISLIAILSLVAGYTESEPNTLTSNAVTLSSPLFFKRATAGQDCTGSEGMWNCMTNSFQRCASGRWSVVMECAAGTQCSPSGTGYQFNIGFSGSGSSTVYTSGTSSQARNWDIKWSGYMCPLILSLLVAIWDRRREQRHSIGIQIIDHSSNVDQVWKFVRDKKYGCMVPQRQNVPEQPKMQKIHSILA